MRLIVLPVQFRTIGEALAGQRVDVAITVADELPAGTHRQALLHGGFVCLYDPRHRRLARPLTLPAYLSYDHVIVSYNGDLRGVVEDTLGITRRVRCSVPSFHALGYVVDGSALVATVPALVAACIRKTRPHLRTATLPFRQEGTGTELIWRSAVDDDEACRFVRAHIVRIAGAVGRRLGR
jgi:LysR family transcriptional activator of mexEF-oprN operon